MTGTPWQYTGSGHGLLSFGFPLLLASIDFYLNLAAKLVSKKRALIRRHPCGDPRSYGERILLVKRVDEHLDAAFDTRQGIAQVIFILGEQLLGLHRRADLEPDFPGDDRREYER